tara:strand:+ start:192 stop:1250 length:1059 start_codon:yes stop_codon:yes gene_type:complete
MSVFRSIATGYLGAKIANTQANDELKARVLESAGTNFYTNILPDAIANEKLRKSNYESLAAIDPNLAELADINGFTASKEAMEKFDQFREENKLKDPDALKNLKFETDFNTRYTTRVKSFEEKYNPILDQIGIKELGGLGFNTVESLIGNKQIQSEDMAKGPVPSDTFASTQLTDYFSPANITFQVDSKKFAAAAQPFGFQGAIKFDPVDGSPIFTLTGTQNTKYRALFAATNDVSSQFLDKDDNVNVGLATEAGAKKLYNQTEGIISTVANNYKQSSAKGVVVSTAEGFTENFNQNYSTDADKKEAFKLHLISLGTKSEQQYFAESFPTGVTFANGKGVKEYLLNLTNKLK